MKYKIKTTEDVNKYHEIVHSFIEDYVIKWKISPKKLKNYLSPGSDNYKYFLERTGLDEVEEKDINRVISDVIDDYCSAETDGIMKFENYTSSEDIFKNITNVNTEYEKILADIFNTSLGFINIKDEKYHLYEVSDFGRISHVIILSKLDIEKINGLIETYSLKSLKAQRLIVNSLGEISLTVPLSFSTGIISDEQFKVDYANMMTSQILLNIIEDYIKIKLDAECEHIKEDNGYHIWKVILKNQGMV